MRNFFNSLVEKPKSGLLFVLISLFLVFWAAPASSVNSGLLYFNTSLNTTYINYTKASLNLTALNVNNTWYLIDNENTSISALYYSVNTYSFLSDTRKDICFGISTRSRQSTNFVVQNISGNETVYVGNLSGNSTATMYLLLYPYCPPGRYRGNFTIYNPTNLTDDFANVTAIIDVPISVNNTYTRINKSAYLIGSFSGNEYHSYFFNNTMDTNLNSVTAVLSGLTNDLDIFLFDENGTYLSGSINKGLLSDELYYTIPNETQYFEIRVFGNASSSYRVDMYFSDLNITNTSNPAKLFESVDLGPLNASSTSPNINFTLRNDGPNNISNITESVEVYYIKNWTNYTQIQDFTDLYVPNFTQNLLIELQWVNSSGYNETDWDLRLFNPSRNSITNSTIKYFISNITQAINTEWVYNETINENNSGFWNISVVNNSNSAPLFSPYNVTAYIYVNSSQWVSSNFTNHTKLNSSDSTDVTINITVPDAEILDGQYMAVITYSNGSGWKQKIRIKFNVKAGMLFMNGNFSNSIIYSVWDNIGINRSYSEKYYTVTINNTGRYPVDYSVNYTTILNKSGSTTRYINLSIENISSPILANSSTTFTLNFSIDTNDTANDAGDYIGWVIFETNSSLNPSYPFRLYNLTVRFRLSNKILVNITTIEPSNVVNPKNASNVSFITTVKFLNGTLISGSPAKLVTGNYSYFRIKHPNVTSYTYSLSGQSVVCSGSVCNATAQSTAYNIPGGIYNVTTGVSFQTHDVTLTGEGEYSYLFVNDTGLLMTENTGISQSVEEGNFTYFNVTVVNYGTEDAVGFLNMSNCTYADVQAYDSKGAACGSATSTYFSVNIAANASEHCWFRWKIITASDVSQDQDCSTAIRTNLAGFNNITGITVSITDSGTTTTTDTTDTGATGDDDGTEETVSNQIEISEYESTISVLVGSWNRSTVYVKNPGNTTYSANVSATMTNSDTGIIVTNSRDSCTLETNEVCDFTFTFDVLNDTTLGDHEGTFKSYVIDDTSTYDSKSFIITVLPTEERMAKINQTYLDYVTGFNNLTEEFNRLNRSGLYDGGNLSVVQKEIAFTQDLIDQIQDAMNSGDYVSAESLTTLLKAKLSEINSAMNAMELIPPSVAGGPEGGIIGAAFGNIWTIAVVIVLIFMAIGLVIYMLLPPEGYHYKYGFTPSDKSQKAKTGVVEKIKNLFRRKKKTPSGNVKVSMPGRPANKEYKRTNYIKDSGDYSKEKGPDYNYKPSKIKQFFKHFKRQKKTGGQSALSDFSSGV